MSVESERGSFAAGLLELLRPPNVFTAVADSAAGLALARGGALRLADPALWTLAASAALYLGGMALNDYFDRATDARERPGRPIPSGRVPAAAAAALGGALLVAGIAFAALAGREALVLGVLLALAIVAYDGGVKTTSAGYVNMGACRGLNFLMPLTLARAEIPPIAWMAPLLLAAYVTVLTFLSRDEVGGNLRPRARQGVVGMGVVFAAVAATLAATGSSVAAWLFFAVVLARAGSLFGPLWREAGGIATGRAIGGGILLIPLFDATFVAAPGHLGAALAVATLALPAMALRRLYSPT